MVHLPGKHTPHIDAHIRFDSEPAKQSRTPTFDGNDRITGVATFNLKKNYEDIRYRVLVRGVVETKILESPPGGLNPNSQVENHTFLSSTTFDGAANASSTSDSKFRTTIPFKFSLQNDEASAETWGLTGEGGGTIQAILPSLNSKVAAKNWKDNFKPGFNADFRITYTVVASAFAERKLVASVSREFSFTPTSAPSPPIAVEDFTDEYALRATKALKSSQASRIGLIGQEPSPLELRRDSRQGSTNVNLFIMQFRPHTNDFDASELPKQLRIKASLRTTTFVMPRRTKADMHTIQAASYNKDASIKQDKTHVQNYTMALNEWQTNESESEDDKSIISEEVFSTAVSFPLRVDGDQLPVPTFYSPLLSRRYAVDLSITFDDQPGSSMKLRLPLQVFYRSTA